MASSVITLSATGLEQLRSAPGLSPSPADAQGDGEEPRSPDLQTGAATYGKAYLEIIALIYHRLLEF